jgi:hypothetical protein
MTALGYAAALCNAAGSTLLLDAACKQSIGWQTNQLLCSASSNVLCVPLQDREHSASLTVFWAGWWPLSLLSFAFVGRAWCAIW